MDEEKKIRQRIWIALGVGLFLTIALAVAAVQFLIKPKREVIATTEATYQSRKTEADKLPGAMVAKRKAEDSRAYVNGQLAFFRQRYRSLYFGNMTVAGTTTQEQATAARRQAWQLWMNEYFNGYGLYLRREIINIANSTGVTLKTDIKVGPPPRAPEEVVVPANGLFRPTGAALPITITGSLSNIMQFFNRINNSSILMLVDRNIKMTGASPDITATFSVTPYLLARGPGAAIQAAAAPAGGAPDGTGGPPTGPPTGPPATTTPPAP